MEKNILLEINRMNELMGLSKLVSEGVEQGVEPLFKLLEKVFATGGEKGIEKVVTKVEQEVTDAIATLEKQKNFGGVPTQEVEKAYEAIAKSLNPDELVKFLKDYKLLGEFEKNVKELSKNIEQQGSSLEVWEKNIDEFIDNATEGMNPELRNSLKKEFKKDIPPSIRQVSKLSREILDEMKSEFPDLFKLKWFWMFEKNPQQLKVLKNKIKSELQNLTKEKALAKIKKEGEEMAQALKRSNLTEPDKNIILRWWDGLKQRPGKIILVALAISIIIFGLKKTGYYAVKVPKEFVKGGYEAWTSPDSTSTPAPSDATKQTPKKQTLSADDLPLPGGN